MPGRIITNSDVESVGTDAAEAFAEAWALTVASRVRACVRV